MWIEIICVLITAGGIWTAFDIGLRTGTKQAYLIGYDDGWRGNAKCNFDLAKAFPSLSAQDLYETAIASADQNSARREAGMLPEQRRVKA